MSNVRLLPGAAVKSGAWFSSCGECRWARSDAAFCNAYGKPVKRDIVGLRVRLPECRQAERAAKEQT